MDKDLQSYVKVYSNWIDKDKCDRTIEEIGKEQWIQHTFYNERAGMGIPVSGSKELDICYSITTTHEYLMKRTWDAINKYVTELNYPWFDGWSGFLSIRFNHYKQGRLMALHCDHITTMFDGERKGVPTLTVLGSLNDNYEGGEFVMWEDIVIPLKAGDLMIFPSNFLYPHKVQEVIKGNRYTFVSWVW
jgi:hypothetical protein